MEWTVVLALVTLVGLFATVVKPVVSLTKAMTQLTMAVEHIDESLSEQRKHSKNAHQKLWAHNDDQDKLLDCHEQRLHDLDGKWSK